MTTGRLRLCGAMFRSKAMLELITLIEFIVAFLMGLAACSFLFWGILDGAFNNLEDIKHRILEIEKDEP
jgi:cbb3-type cytochrome oxidase maturation protein